MQNSTSNLKLKIQNTIFENFKLKNSQSKLRNLNRKVVFQRTKQIHSYSKYSNPNNKVWNLNSEYTLFQIKS